MPRFKNKCLRRLENQGKAVKKKSRKNKRKDNIMKMHMNQLREKNLKNQDIKPNKINNKPTMKNINPRKYPIQKEIHQKNLQNSKLN